jgi:hypothetical protein
MDMDKMVDEYTQDGGYEDFKELRHKHQNKR